MSAGYQSEHQRGDIIVDGALLNEINKNTDPSGAISGSSPRPSTGSPT
jgi:hypothetical protein